ncbi:MAG TPA: pYEATS domain-containing protein [Verrucomicrobiae bacterium]|jgi:transcription initiation factor IIF auxiliary subunit|nr:pYEATS domain-containing protein [Verrucomicrobiae bacterium]
MKIAQDFEYQGDDWWKWWIWIDATDAELNQIDQVVYNLHSTFPEPVRTVKDRSSKFRLKTAGWGVFRIYADVFLEEGPPKRLIHDLVLRYPNGTPTKA